MQYYGNIQPNGKAKMFSAIIFRSGACMQDHPTHGIAFSESASERFDT